MAMLVVVVFDFFFFFSYGFGGGLMVMDLVAMLVVWCLILSVGLILAMGFGCNMAFLQCVMMYMNFAKMALFFFFFEKG